MMRKPFSMIHRPPSVVHLPSSFLNELYQFFNFFRILKCQTTEQKGWICTRQILKYHRSLTVFLNYHTIFMKIFSKT